MIIKKRFCLYVILSLIFLNLFSIIGQATDCYEEEINYVISISTSQAIVEKDKVVYVYIGVNHDFAASEIRIVYDHSKFTFSPSLSDCGFAPLGGRQGWQNNHC